MTAQHKDIVSQWAKKAEDDLRAATIIIHDSSPPTAIVCFHCHQTIEKYFKAFLIKKDGQLYRVHDLVYLLNQCIKHDQSFDSLREKVISLNRYYIETRYPADMPVHYSNKEAVSAVDDAHFLRNFIRKKLARTKAFST